MDTRLSGTAMALVAQDLGRLEEVRTTGTVRVRDALSRRSVSG